MQRGDSGRAGAPMRRVLGTPAPGWPSADSLVVTPQICLVCICVRRRLYMQKHRNPGHSCSCDADTRCVRVRHGQRDVQSTYASSANCAYRKEEPRFGCTACKVASAPTTLKFDSISRDSQYDRWTVPNAQVPPPPCAEPAGIRTDDHVNPSADPSSPSTSFASIPPMTHSFRTRQFRTQYIVAIPNQQQAMAITSPSLDNML